jgi:hypothetical protein
MDDPARWRAQHATQRATRRTDVVVARRLSFLNLPFHVHTTRLDRRHGEAIDLVADMHCAIANHGDVFVAVFHDHRDAALPQFLELRLQLFDDRC